MLNFSLWTQSVQPVQPTFIHFFLVKVIPRFIVLNENNFTLHFTGGDRLLGILVNAYKIPTYISPWSSVHT